MYRPKYWTCTGENPTTFQADDLKDVSELIRLGLPGGEVGRRQFWGGELAEQLRRFVHLVFITDC